MKVLVIGSGGREHALCKKLTQSLKVSKVWCAPGNGGISKTFDTVKLDIKDIDAIADFAQKAAFDLTVVGPEVPLAAGIVDEFQERGLKIFGPTKVAAEIESSKVFAKQLMGKYGIPTANFVVAENPEDAKQKSEEFLEKTGGVVVKADGLAAGKGVFVCKTKEEAHEAVENLLVKKVFGEAGNRIVIEEMLKGEEVSFMVFSDGKNALPMPAAQDHKRIFDNDNGPNTGGMGAYSPVPSFSAEMESKVMKEIILPTIGALEQEGRPYKGVLYAGLMLTESGPKVLEFNCRFGDPETQVVIPRLKSDLAETCLACINGTLDQLRLKWDTKSAVCVVLASAGYPGDYEKDIEIFGLEKLNAMDHIDVFHSGVYSKGGIYYTNGGRVLGITALGRDLKAAIARAYEAVKEINFKGMQHRTDIGKKGLLT